MAMWCLLTRGREKVYGTGVLRGERQGIEARVGLGNVRSVRTWLGIIKDLRTALLQDPLPVETMTELLRKTAGQRTASAAHLLPSRLLKAVQA
jgi:hypothetical protein